MSIWVDDVDDVHQRCIDQGLDITWPPTNMPWGVREMHVRHPDGHVFRVSQGSGNSKPGEMQSDIERNIAIVRELVQAMDAGDPAALDSLCTPGFVAHFNGIDLSLAQVREAAAGFVAAFPNLKHSIRSIEAADDRVTLQALDTATHRGTYKEIPATNLKVQFETAATYRIEAGKIAEVWQQMDVEELMRQLRNGMR